MVRYMRNSLCICQRPLQFSVYIYFDVLRFPFHGNDQPFFGIKLMFFVVLLLRSPRVTIMNIGMKALSTIGRGLVEIILAINRPPFTLWPRQQYSTSGYARIVVRTDTGFELSIFVVDPMRHTARDQCSVNHLGGHC